MELVHIASAGNSDTACLQLLLDKGYKVKVTFEGGDLDEEPRSHYHATKEGFSFAAESSMELLGLATLGETWGQEWQSKGLGRNAHDQVEFDDEN